MILYLTENLGEMVDLAGFDGSSIDYFEISERV